MMIGEYKIAENSRSDEPTLPCIMVIGLHLRFSDICRSTHLKENCGNSVMNNIGVKIDTQSVFPVEGSYARNGSLSLERRCCTYCINVVFLSKAENKPPTNIKCISIQLILLFILLSICIDDYPHLVFTTAPFLSIFYANF